MYILFVVTFYQVKARPKSNLIDLRYDLSHGNIRSLIPFGASLQYSLENAKLDEDNNHAVWIEEDYCNPPIAMERKAVLDKYFDNIRVQTVISKEEGWSKIQHKRSLWADLYVNNNCND